MKDLKFSKMQPINFVHILLYLVFLHAITLLAEGYELTIIHNNDIHAHFEQINKYSGECSEEEASEEKCYGGEARRVTFITEARASIPNTLVLNAGDWFIGTCMVKLLRGVWYNGIQWGSGSAILCRTPIFFFFTQNIIFMGNDEQINRYHIIYLKYPSFTGTRIV